MLILLPICHAFNRLYKMCSDPLLWLDKQDVFSITTFQEHFTVYFILPVCVPHQIRVFGSKLCMAVDVTWWIFTCHHTFSHNHYQKRHKQHTSDKQHTAEQHSIGLITWCKFAVIGQFIYTKLQNDRDDDIIIRHFTTQNADNAGQFSCTT